MNLFRLYLMIIVYGFIIKSSFGQELIPFYENGNRGNRVNICFIAEGYQSGERSQFIQDMEIFEQTIVGDAPYDGYKEYFNVYGIFVASNESGADDPNGSIVRDTYFDATYNTAGIDRLLTVNGTTVNMVVTSLVPECDIPLVIVNYHKYGGSGGMTAVANSTSPEIVAHEIGHSWAGLADEYESPYPGFIPREQYNVTAMVSGLEQLSWRHWVEEVTPLPTPKTIFYESVVGAFEGAQYQSTGWYRPRQQCRMRENGIPLGEVCSEKFILEMYNKVSPIQNAFPQNDSAIRADSGDLQSFSVDAMNPELHNLEFAWFINGEIQSENISEQLEIQLRPEFQSVEVLVHDPTPLVRKDPDSLLYERYQWILQVAGFDNNSSNRSSSSNSSSSIAIDNVCSSSSICWCRLEEGGLRIEFGSLAVIENPHLSVGIGENPLDSIIIENMASTYQTEYKLYFDDTVFHYDHQDVHLQIKDGQIWHPGPDSTHFVSFAYDSLDACVKVALGSSSSGVSSSSGSTLIGTHQPISNQGWRVQDNLVSMFSDSIDQGTLKMIDITGKVIWKIENISLKRGVNHIEWVPSKKESQGIYILSLETSTQIYKESIFIFK